LYKIKVKEILTNHSLLNNIEYKYDYIDSFEGTIVDKENMLTSFDVCKAFFSSAPKWIDKLLQLRNRIVSIFALKTFGKINNRQQLLVF
jgi:hypothetical protein